MPLACGLFLLTAGSASAGLSAIEVGVKGPNVEGERAVTLVNRVGFGAAAYLGEVATGTHLVASLGYQPYRLKNADDVSLNFLNMMAGAQLRGGKQVLGLAPAVALQLGAAYGWTSIANATGTTLNSKVYFTAAAVPSLEFPIWGSLSGSVNLEAQVIFNRPSNLIVFSESLMLRWSL